MTPFQENPAKVLLYWLCMIRVSKNKCSSKSVMIITSAKARPSDCTILASHANDIKHNEERIHTAVLQQCVKRDRWVERGIYADFSCWVETRWRETTMKLVSIKFKTWEIKAVLLTKIFEGSLLLVLFR